MSSCRLILPHSCSSQARVRRVRRDVRARGSAIDDEKSDIKFRLLRIAAPTNRGKYADAMTRAVVEEMCKRLSSISDDTVPVLGSPPAIEGRWRLIYSSGDILRTSPLFWALETGLLRSREVARTVFSFTDTLTAAEAGESVKVVDLYSGTLESRLAVSVVPGIRAVLVTQCKVLPAPPTTLSIVVERTRVERATTPLAPLLNSLALPVRALAELAGGTGASSVAMTTLFVDRDTWVARAEPSGDLMVFEKL